MRMPLMTNVSGILSEAIFMNIERILTRKHKDKRQLAEMMNLHNVIFIALTD